MDKDISLAHRHAGINWLYWITGLSLLNTVIAVFDGGYNFIVGLGYTQILDAVMSSFKEEYSYGAMIFLLVMSLLVSGFFAFSGYMTQLGQRGWYLASIILYTLDTFLYLYIQDYVGIGFHIFVLAYLYRGYQGHRSLIQWKLLESSRP